MDGVALDFLEAYEGRVGGMHEIDLQSFRLYRMASLQASRDDINDIRCMFFSLLMSLG